MKSRTFIGRRKELLWFNDIDQRKGFRFVVVTGRRRIGKTRLINEFLKDRDHFRVQFEKRKADSNLDKMNSEIGDQLKIPKPDFSSFTEAFEYLRDRKIKIVVLDEFSYIIRYSDVVGEFQTIIDEVLKDSDMMLIVMGSSFSIMKMGIFEYSAPLYGRSEGMLNLQPLDIIDVMEWFPNMKFKDLFLLYSILGGVPRYLEFVKDDMDLEKQLEELFLDPNTFLFREAKQLMEEEFDDPSTYYSILESISRGSSKVTRIGKGSFLDPSKVSKYLSVLVDIGIVKKELPFGHRRKQGIYYFRDPYFRFWFRFVSDLFEEIESDDTEGAVLRYRKDLDTFMGRAFEDSIRKVISRMLPFVPLKIGKWWKGGVEIDWIAEGMDDIAFVEVKWKKMKKRDVERTLWDLRSRSKEYGNVSKKEHHVLFCIGTSGRIPEDPSNVHV
ncbi:MAG: ATP-binding protein, partial [Candidatus Thermoplasmatota archaeon]|nr:ATP-binding protein [Candidatus Thermoplasmatota archaeon]